MIYHLNSHVSKNPLILPAKMIPAYRVYYLNLIFNYIIIIIVFLINIFPWDKQKNSAYPKNLLNANWYRHEHPPRPMTSWECAVSVQLQNLKLYIIWTKTLSNVWFKFWLLQEINLPKPIAWSPPKHKNWFCSLRISGIFCIKALLQLIKEA